jgi:hypothetical protein
VRRPTIAGVVVVVGVLLLADYLVVNASLGELARLAIDAAILVAAGAGLAAVASLLLRRGGDLWRRRGDPVGAVLVIVGAAAMLIAGLRPGSSGASDPAVGWLLNALVIPISATLFGLLFATTLSAARRSLDGRAGGREASLLVGVAIVSTLLLLPLSGAAGEWMDQASAWAMAVPIGAVFRGLLLGIAIVAATFAARTMLGIGAADE